MEDFLAAPLPEVAAAACRLRVLNERESSLLDGDNFVPELDIMEGEASADPFDGEDESEGEEGRNSTWTVTPSNRASDSELIPITDWMEADAVGLVVLCEVEWWWTDRGGLGTLKRLKLRGLLV